MAEKINNWIDQAMKDHGFSRVYAEDQVARVLNGERGPDLHESAQLLIDQLDY